VDLPQALKALAGNPKLLAQLPPYPPHAPAIIVTPQMRILDVRSGKPCKWAPRFSDIVSIQWEIVDMSIPRPARPEA